MEDKDQRTEQPTQQRIRKARAEGRFPSSRETVSAVQFLAFAAVLTATVDVWWPALLHAMKALLLAAFQQEVTLQWVAGIWRSKLVSLLAALAGAGALVTGAGLLAQLAVTGFGFAPSRLMPDVGRVSPAANLRELPRRNRDALMESLLMLPVLLAVCWLVVSKNTEPFFRLPLLSLPGGAAQVGGAISDLLWKAALVLAVWGAIDVIKQRRRYLKDLRMTKQEIREEYKQNEGQPEIKMKIRRLRRELLRRRMMAEVPKATAVVVNPTHYAVALRYELHSAGAPKVVAKGKNYLALRIRARAMEHQVPIVENPPLAQALYRQVEVGQEIPAHLYRAVAEVLAYIYRLMQGRADSARGERRR